MLSPAADNSISIWLLSSHWRDHAPNETCLGVSKQAAWQNRREAILLIYSEEPLLFFAFATQLNKYSFIRSSTTMARGRTCELSWALFLIHTTSFLLPPPHQIQGGRMVSFRYETLYCLSDCVTIHKHNLLGYIVNNTVTSTDRASCFHRITV